MLSWIHQTIARIRSLSNTWSFIVLTPQVSLLYGNRFHSHQPEPREHGTRTIIDL